MSNSTTLPRSTSASARYPEAFEELSARLRTIEPAGVVGDEHVAAAEVLWIVVEGTIAVLEETVDVVETIDFEALLAAIDTDELPDAIDVERLAAAIERGDSDGAIETIDPAELLEAIDLLALWRSVDLPALLKEGGELKTEIGALEASLVALSDGEDESEPFEELSARSDALESVLGDALVVAIEAIRAIVEETIDVLRETIDVLETVDAESLPEAVDADELSDAIDADRLPDAIERGDPMEAIDLAELHEAVDLLKLWRSVDLPAFRKEGTELEAEIVELEAALDDLLGGDAEGENDGDDPDAEGEAESDSIDGDEPSWIKNTTKGLLSAGSRQGALHRQAVEAIDAVRVALLETHAAVRGRYEANRRRFDRGSRRPTVHRTLPRGPTSTTASTVPARVRHSRTKPRPRVYGRRFERVGSRPGR